MAQFLDTGCKDSAEDFGTGNVSFSLFFRAARGRVVAAAASSTSDFADGTVAFLMGKGRKDDGYCRKDRAEDRPLLSSMHAVTARSSTDRNAKTRLTGFYLRDS